MGGYILDFYCAEARLAIEVDGNVHQEPGQAEYDRQRSSDLAEMGIEVMRFWNDEVLNRTEETIERVIQKIKERGVAN